MQLQAEAAKWKGAKEIVEESITKDGIVTAARFVSVIEAPLAKVQDAVWGVESSAGRIPNVKLSQLVKQEGNTKTLKMQLQALTLPVQHYTMQFTLDAAAHKISFKTTESQAQDIEGSYQLEASPDGQRTRIVYESKATDKIAVPFPQSLIEGATRETFVNTIRGVKSMVQG
jgi:hypothetical protein